MQDEQRGKMMEQNTQNPNTSTRTEYPFSPAKRIFSRVGMSLFIMFLLTTVLTMIYAEAARVFFPEFLLTNTAYIIACMLIQNGVGILVVFLMLRGLPVVKPQERSHMGRSWFGIFAACYALLIVGNEIGAFVSLLISDRLGYEIGAFALEMTMTLPLWCEFLVVVIIAPIGEELIFRKLIIDRISIFGEKTAVVISALIFALFHGNFYQFFYAFFIGALFGYVYVKSRNIFLTMSLHAAINFCGSVLAGAALEILENFMAFAGSAISESGELLIDEAQLIANMPLILKTAGVLIYALFMYGMIIYGWIFIAKRIKKLTFARGPLQIPRGNGFAVAFGNVGMFLFSLESVFLFVQQMLPAEFWSNL